MDFSAALEHVFQYEGGLVDHPKDPGGITKYGISLRAYPELEEDGIRNLTKEQAAQIYKDDYWDVMHCDQLPAEMRLMVFDCAVNQGTNFAAKALQAAVSTRTDGIIGAKTLAAAHEVPVEQVVHKYARNRFARYAANKNWATFADGWMSRLLSVTLLTFK